MTKCLACEEKFGENIFCSFEFVVSDEEVVKKRVPATADCKYCKVKKGQVHHLGCKAEPCPICGEADIDKCEHIWTHCVKPGTEDKELKKYAYFEKYPRLILLTILTAGLYPFWWMYKTWKFIIKRERFELNPVVLTLLWPVYIFLLISYIKKIGEEHFLYHITGYLIGIIAVSMWTAWIWDRSFLWLIPFTFIPYLNLEESMRKIYRREFLE